jgi:hypothetical protein
MPKEKILPQMKKVVLAKDHPGIVDVLPHFCRGFYLFSRRGNIRCGNLDGNLDGSRVKTVRDLFCGPAE